MPIKPFLLALALTFCIEAPAQVAAALAPIAQPSSVQPPPPLPFRYIGRLTHNGRQEVLLMRGEALHSVAAGDRIGEEYRVEGVGESRIRFTYLPLGIQQSLDTPAVRWP